MSFLCVVLFFSEDDLSDVEDIIILPSIEAVIDNVIQILKYKAEEKGLFPETYLDVNTLTLVSLTAIDGVDVYKVKVKEDSYRYYDAATGLLVRTEKSEEQEEPKEKPCPICEKIKQLYTSSIILDVELFCC